MVTISARCTNEERRLGLVFWLLLQQVRVEKITNLPGGGEKLEKDGEVKTTERYSTETRTVLPKRPFIQK